MPAQKSLKQHAYDRIQTKLLTQGVGAGVKLSDRALANEIGISRTPVREALSQLESEGLLSQISGLGTVLRIPTRMELEEFYDLRIMLENYAVSRAARYATGEDLRTLDIIQEKTMRVGKHLIADPSGFSGDLGKEWVLVDVEFHRALHKVGKCRQTLKIIDNLRILSKLAGPQHLGSDETRIHRLGQTYRDHAQIVRALRNHDAPTACAVMTRHLLRAKKMRLERYDERHEAEAGSSEVNWAQTVLRLIDESQ